MRGWLLARDPRLQASRRAARTALVLPAVFAFGAWVIRNPTVALFAGFGTFAMLLFAEFGGTLVERLAAQTALIATGSVLICGATLASMNAWVAAVAMLVVGFGVLFAGIVSSALATASTSVLLSFILPVATPASPAAVPDRLAGWLLAGAVSLPAIAILWPAPRREPLRDAAAQACRRLSARLTAEAARTGDGADESVEEAVAGSDAAVAALRAAFLATPYRPSGLTTAARAVVRLVDKVLWLDVILTSAALARRRGSAPAAVREVDRAAAVLLEHAGRVLDLRDPPHDSLRAHLEDLTRARRAVETGAAEAIAPAGADVPGIAMLSVLDPSFRAQELTFAVTAIGEDIETVTVAEQRNWWQKILGRPGGDLSGSLSSARRRARSRVEPHSVWLHNSIRGAIALAGAVLVADLSGAQHSFWIVLGALSVLRSTALSTGQSAVRGLVGTAVGVVLGGALVVALGTNMALLWVLLPLAILVAGVAPAISFTAGQAGFTVTLLILFNIIGPAGWQVGLVRVEDVAIGCAVSLVVGATFWPRGAGPALRQAVSGAYAQAAVYLRAAVASAATEGGSDGSAEEAARRAAAAARRLDDAFREYLAERGTKHLTLAEVATLLTGVAGLRLTAEAVRNLWSRNGVPSHRPADTSRAWLELISTTERVTNWYAAMAQAVSGIGVVPQVLPPDVGAGSRLRDALRLDLAPAGTAGVDARPDAVRLIWTSDHVDAARRLQETVAQPARTAAFPRGRDSATAWRRRRPGAGRASRPATVTPPAPSRR